MGALRQKHSHRPSSRSLLGLAASLFVVSASVVLAALPFVHDVHFALREPCPTCSDPTGELHCEADVALRETEVGGCGYVSPVFDFRGGFFFACAAKFQHAAADEEYVEEDPVDEEELLKAEAARKEAKKAKRKLSVASHLGKIKIKPLAHNPSSANTFADLANSLKGAKKERSASNRALEREKGLIHELQKDKSVRKLPSGVMFRILAKGKGGNSPTVDPYGSGEFHGVTIRYSARYAVGKQKGVEFDNSELLAEAKTAAAKLKGAGKFPNPFRSPLDPTSGRIKGVSEALQLMREGDKWEVYIPAALGFGDDGVDDTVPPYMTLVYTIELLEVENGPGRKDSDDNEAIFLRYWGLEYSDL